MSLSFLSSLAPTVFLTELLNVWHWWKLCAGEPQRTRSITLDIFGRFHQECSIAAEMHFESLSWATKNQTTFFFLAGCRLLAVMLLFSICVELLLGKTCLFMFWLNKFAHLQEHSKYQHTVDCCSYQEKNKAISAFHFKRKHRAFCSVWSHMKLQQKIWNCSLWKLPWLYSSLAISSS